MNKKVAQGHWDSVTEVVSLHMRRGDLMQGLLNAIVLTGDVLAKILPDDGGQSHEISTDFRVQE